MIRFRALAAAAAPSAPSSLFSPSRRALLAGLATLAATAMLPRAARAEEVLRVGLLDFGTAAWIADTITVQGLDRAGGFRLEPVRLASNDAARIAFQAGEVDTIVSDLLLAARSTAEGRPTVFEPFSSAEGALMVPAGSSIGGLADLRGKKIGVAGGALDKGWLLLVAEARRTAGLDLVREAEPLFGAPPLLQRKAETGELEAILTYWSFAARLEAKGFRRLTDVGTLARAFGVTGDVALLGWIFRRPFAEAHRDLLGRFTEATRAAGDLLASDPAAWARIAPQVRAEDAATDAALKARFLAGRPKRPIAEEEADARRLFAALAAIGGADLVGPATSLPAGLYRTRPDGGT